MQWKHRGFQCHTDKYEPESGLYRSRVRAFPQAQGQVSHVQGACRAIGKPDTHLGALQKKGWLCPTELGRSAERPGEGASHKHRGSE